MRKYLTLICVLISLVANAQSKRVALVIGNSNYSGHFDKLSTPEKDADDVANAFKRLKFDSVQVHKNLNREQMLSCINSFRMLAKGAEEAVLYFVGHGCWKKDKYYLAPSGDYPYIDNIPSSSILFESIDEIVSNFSARRRVMFIDACQNNVDGVMSIVSPRNKDDFQRNTKAASGVIRFFSTSKGQFAKTGATHSIFTQAFLNHIGEYGSFRDVWKNITTEVLNSNREQRPEYSSKSEELINELVFNPYKVSLNPCIIDGKETLQFNIYPSTADLYINDVLYKERNIILNFGQKYKIRVSATGYEPEETTFTFAPKYNTIDFNLEKQEPVTLSISSNVKNASIFIDDAYIGETPIYKLKTFSGTHTIRASKSNSSFGFRL